MNTVRCQDENRPGPLISIVDFNRCEGKGAFIALCPYDAPDVRKIDLSNHQKLPKPLMSRTSLSKSHE